jgi:hypothetical protein
LIPVTFSAIHPRTACYICRSPEHPHPVHINADRLSENALDAQAILEWLIVTKMNDCHDLVTALALALAENRRVAIIDWPAEKSVGRIPKSPAIKAAIVNSLAPLQDQRHAQPISDRDNPGLVPNDEVRARQHPRDLQKVIDDQMAAEKSELGLKRLIFGRKPKKNPIAPGVPNQPPPIDVGH